MMGLLYMLYLYLTEKEDIPNMVLYLTLLLLVVLLGLSIYLINEYDNLNDELKNNNVIYINHILLFLYSVISGIMIIGLLYKLYNNSNNSNNKNKQLEKVDNNQKLEQVDNNQKLEQFDNNQNQVENNQNQEEDSQ